MYRKYLLILISLQKNIHLVTSVADLGCLSWIQIFPSRIQGQKDSGSQRSQRKMIRDVHPGSGSRFLPIPDPGVKKAPEPGSRVYLFHFLKKVKFVAPY